MHRAATRRARSGRLAAIAAVALVSLAAAPGFAAPRVTVQGPGSGGPLTPDANGRFAFPNLPLLRNAVNTFTVTATDDFGNAQSQDVRITQIDLDNVVVSQVTSRPLAVQEIEQLVRDGVIDLEDPENYNVSSFNIVLTIEREEFVIAIPIVRGNGEQTGSEVIAPKSDPGNGTSSRPRAPDTEIVVFEVVPTVPGFDPPRIPGVIIIQGDIKTLKEFFEVRLLLMNTSGIFTLSDVQAMIGFPEGGLSPTLPEDGIALFGDILPGDPTTPGQKQREFIIRGDEIGRKPIEVSFGGTITGPGIPEEDPIPFNGSALTSVEVKGPPTFDVRVSHPDEVVAGVTYELAVDITNTGDSPALYASLELAIGGDAEIVECSMDETTGEPECHPIDPPAIRRFGHIFPGDRVREVFTVLPHVSGRVTSCMGVADQNIALQVLVGNIGCVTGNFPVVRDSVNGVPAFNVLPLPNAFGLSISTPVTVFFSEGMDQSTITTNGPAATLRVIDDAGVDVPGRIRFVTLTERTIAVWQVEDGITNRLRDNTRYTVFLADTITDLAETTVASSWTSTFTTTSSTNDETPPFLTLSIEPPVDPTHVLPGQVIRINAYPTDQGTGVSGVELRMQDTDVPGSGFALIDQKTVFNLSEQGPLIFAVDSANLVPGHTYQFRGTAIDNANNRQDATIAAIIATSTAAPQIDLPPSPVDPVLHGISVPLAPNSISSTVKTVDYYLDFDVAPFATLFLAPFQTAATTLGLPLGQHTVRAVATDALGQTGEDLFEFTLIENINEPSVSFNGFTGGRYTIGSRIPVNGDAEDELGIAAAAFFVDDPNGAPVATGLDAFLLDTAALAAGVHRLFLIATNGVGNSNDPTAPASFVDFEVVDTPVGGAPPPAPVLGAIPVPAGGRTTVSGTASAGGQLTLANVTSGLVATFAVAGDGSFTTEIDASPGDQLSAVVLDLAISIDPSAAALAIVPAPPVLLSISAAPPSLSFSTLGALQNLVVTASYGDGSSQNVTAQASYSTGNAAVASVSGGGGVHSSGNGSTSIGVAFGGLTASVPVEVTARVLESISVAPASVTLPAIGATQALTVTSHFSDSTAETLTTGLAFSTSAPAVIGVTGGVVRAIAIGSGIVTVSRSGVAPVLVPVDVDTGLDDPPTIAFQSPVAGTGFERGQNVGVTAFATDAIGVARVTLTASGAATFSETRQITPSATSTSPSISFAMPSDAPIGGTVTLTLQAEDTGGNFSTLAVRDVTVVDRSDPSVSITAPAIDAAYGYGDEVEVVVAADDAVAVAEIRYEVIGITGVSGTQPIAPPQASAGATFHFTIPIGLVASQVEIRAFARDAAGNEGESAPVPITITDADTTPPETFALSASAPVGALTTVSYEVTAGLADLEHVELYFRRNGLGTFSRYTGPLGDGTGEFTPQSGATGTMAFDATRMGGDGAYEFFTVGVDRAGNREAPPEDAGEIIGDPGVAATIATGAPVAVIATDTELFGPTLDGQSLRVVGATLTVVGSHAFGNVELRNGAVLTQRETTQSEAFGVELSAWTLSVDATSRIDVVGRGHLGGNRSGLAETAHTSGFAPGAQNGTGGSYGGLGGDFAGNGASVPNPVYGNVANPVDLGSGGGAWGGDGGDGGGRVLVGAINLIVDGSILANGGLSAGSASGEGSGGSVNLTLRTLSGLGAIAADGGTANGGNHSGGGGGRIAVRSLDRATYDLSLVTARGGDGFYGDGADGTIFLLGEGETGGELVINGVGPTSPITDLIMPPGQSFDSITLQNGANVIAQGPIVLAETLRLRGSSRLAHPTASEAGLSITARDVIVESGSAIDATGRGYLGGNKAGLGETAHTLGFTPGSQPATGGSHGGLGGDWSGNGANLPAPVYGDPKRPARLGAGGGAWAGAGGDGGGAIRIVASDRVIVDGAIRANGGISGGSASGEGAGGSVWIETARLAGAGTIEADGGTQNNGNHTGGGGGRVALYLHFVDPSSDLGGLRNVTARGGDGFYADAASGTVYLHVPGDVDGTLVIDGVMPAGQTHPVATELAPIGPGLAAAVSADSLVVDGSLPRAFTPNALVGLRLNPNLVQAEDFEIASNTADAIAVMTPNENGVAFANVASAGASYAGAWHFDAIRFQRGGFLEAADPLVVAGELALAENALLVHPETTQVYAADLLIDAGAITIEATSGIDVSGRGYLGGNRAGFGEVAHTLGFAAGSQPATGGSHGGLGGDWPSNGASVPNPVYGNPSAPRELGAGGGAWGGAGGDGGGRVAIVADSLVVHGALRADGGISGGTASGEGAGGSLDLRVGSLSGMGVISASGGTTGNGNHTGGGGGRIAIRHGGALGFPLANARAVGGDGFYGDGGHGSVFVLAPGQTYGDVIYDGHGFTPPPDSVVIPAGLVADNLVLRDGVRAVAGEITADTLRLEAGATLTHAPQSETGLQLDVRELVVESGAAIDVTGRGYLGGGKGGLGDTAHTFGFALGAEAGSGGSHGGIGGDYSGNGSRAPSPVYGDPRRPTALGGGGGAWGGVGGDGGGAVRIVASESVAVSGAIRANGGISGGTASGEGAGGSVWIETATIGGTGTISADGGTTGNANHTGGGGGRIAIYADAVDAASDLLDARRATAYGGDGFYGDGAPGTVFVALGGVETLIFDAGRTIDRWTPEASLPAVGPGVAVTTTGDSLTVDGTLPAPGIAVNHLVGVRLNPNTAQDESFAVIANAADTITVATPNENGVHFADVALAGAPYAAAWRFANVLLRGGASLSLFDPLAVDGTLAVAERSLLAHPATTAIYEAALEVEAGTLSIDVTSAIDVTGRGYLGGNKAGLGETAHTLGLAPGAQSGTGGSYGGLGGDYPSNGASVPNPVYGNASDPFELGSGGGAWGGNGGDGGGRVRIDAGTLLLDGAIRADGGLSSGTASGEGSGGAVNVQADSIGGSGAISADGGTTGNSNHTGGGGGRLAIRTATVPLPISTSAAGGDGFYADGQPGTIFLGSP